MDKEELESYKKAGQIAAECLEYAKSLVKPDVKFLDVAEQTEAKILKLGGKIAFPVNLSTNEVAAHYTPFPDDEKTFTETDLIKVDVGVHVNGYIGDTALTVDLGNNYKELVEASRKALDNAIQVIRHDISLGEIGSIIQDTIKHYGFSSIKNLSGHEMDKYELHTGIQIPNYDTEDPSYLENDQVIAIEPFATNGLGIVTDGNNANIFSLIRKKPVRLPMVRNVLNFIESEYNHMPFTTRWLTKKFPVGQVGFALKHLLQQRIIKGYNPLPEKGNGMVSQAEHTVIIKDKVIVTTKNV